MDTWLPYDDDGVLRFGTLSSLVTISQDPFGKLTAVSRLIVVVALSAALRGAPRVGCRAQTPGATRTTIGNMIVGEPILILPILRHTYEVRPTDPRQRR